MRMGTVALALSVSLAFAAAARAADQNLIDAARREGQVTWYTTLLAAQLSDPMAAAFEKKYGIKVVVVSLPNDVVLRITTEADAGLHIVDVFDGPDTVAALKPRDLVLKWQPDIAAGFPADIADPDGYWTASNLFVQTLGYNTDLVPKGAAPKTSADLLDPRWKGKMAFTVGRTMSGGPGLVGAVLLSMGEAKGMDYLRALARQNITTVSAGARRLLDQVIEGEFPIALQIFNYHAVISAAKGAPVAWAPSSPSTVSASVVSVAQKAPHPNAGKLLADFLVSEEGQALFRVADYVPANPKVPPKDPSLRPGPTTFEAVSMSPDTIHASMPRWGEVFDALFK